MALAPVSMGLAYDYSWLTLDNKLTNSFFFFSFSRRQCNKNSPRFRQTIQELLCSLADAKIRLWKKKKQNNNLVATIDGGHNQLSRYKTIKT